MARCMIRVIELRMGIEEVVAIAAVMRGISVSYLLQISSNG